MFVLSTAFPVAASLLPVTAVSRAMGVLDGALPLVLVVVGIYIVSVNPTTLKRVSATA